MAIIPVVRPRSGASIGDRRQQQVDRQSAANPLDPPAPISKILPTPRRRWTAGTSGIAFALTLTVAACAHPPADPEARAEYERNNDPAEPTNRVIFSGNKFVDDHALQPVARGYQTHVPDRVRKSIHNFVSNLGQPSIAVNDALQGNFSRSWNTIQRFAINTTVGGVGRFRVLLVKGCEVCDSSSSGEAVPLLGGRRSLATLLHCSGINGINFIVKRHASTISRL